MGFGQGPRSCLGMRFALLEAKMALAAVIREFDFSVKMKIQLKFTWFGILISQLTIVRASIKNEPFDN
jgi:thromboxane-A synthase